MDRFSIFVLSLVGFAWLTAVGAAHHVPGASVLQGASAGLLARPLCSHRP